MPNIVAESGDAKLLLQFLVKSNARCLKIKIDRSLFKMRKDLQGIRIDSQRMGERECSAVGNTYEDNPICLIWRSR